MKRALILGVSGQDGAYLSKLLLAKGYEVHGTSRDAEMQSFARLHALGIRDRVQTHSTSGRDFREMLQLLTNLRPDEIYNLAGQTSVSLSFSQPIEAIDSIAQATLILLEVVRYLKLPVRIYNASSSESFGETPAGAACEERTPFQPRSPYATAKATAHWTTANYREAYGIYACSGILFNHESPLRGDRFVTKKIVSAAIAIASAGGGTLTLGDLSVARDWGYAPEYVEAMWRMLQQERPDDYVIATGESHTVEEFVSAAFAEAGLDWREHVRIDPSLFRPSDIRYSRGNAAKAAHVLGWTPSVRFRELVPLLVRAERERTA
ncbi:MAG TPA: GDP-mannose 4,6-dehydratase [Thermoanaerobaculia bacterium]|nr:GDP-mannose 4,6-dehydratase [Thermoanaerobaculia bacterium]